MHTDPSIDSLDTMSDQDLVQLPWKDMTRLNGRLLQLHAEGQLGNEESAKLPRVPILCIDRVDVIDDSSIEASFTFPASETDWPYAADESLEMLFQDQLDQLVGFWGARKTDGIGRALSSATCTYHQPLTYAPNKTIRFSLQKRRWIQNADSPGGTAVFNGKILDHDGQPILETKNIIVGILRPADVHALRDTLGGLATIEPQALSTDLRIPIYDSELNYSNRETDTIEAVSATQCISPEDWPFQYHFRGDPVVPGNFGTHGMISLLKQVASDAFGLQNPVFKSLSKKNFSGMVFQDKKQIRFELRDIKHGPDNQVSAAQANLYLENSDGSLLLENPIYTFKNIVVCESPAD